MNRASLSFNCFLHYKIQTIEYAILQLIVSLTLTISVRVRIFKGNWKRTGAR